MAKHTVDADDPHKPSDPTDLTAQSWKFVARRSAREFTRDQCTDLAAALTYYAVLSLFPALLALVSLLGVVGQGRSSVDTVMELVAAVGPDSAVDTMRGTVEQLVEAPTAGFALIVGLAGALWSASGYVGAFGRAMNRMYEVDEGRPVWKLRPLQLAVTLAGLLLVAAVILMLVVSGPVAKALGDQLGIGAGAVTTWNIAKWPVILVCVTLAVAVLYYVTPNVKQPKFRWISVGAALAIAVWIVASVGFAFYVSHFGSYNKTYGSLAGAVIFLLWLWITNLALLFGAEVDAELERGRQLQAGIEAEEFLRLPPRDTSVSDKNARQRAHDIAAGRELRETHGGEDNEGNSTMTEQSDTRAPALGTSPPKATDPTDPHSLSTVQLVERLTTQMSDLVRAEMSHAVTEVKSKSTRLGVGVGISGAGALLLLYGLAVLLAAAVLGLATVLAPWLAALIVGGVVIVVGAVTTLVGAQRAKSAAPPVPEETVQSVKTDIATAKKGLK
ncbi:YhjD/YihY/BrkB family envelope integrity protein [Rhodococcus qingshengii]|uniref:YhjD/YihY/BrkB family envelope integrity protein n=1 Tax=Rhodococcus qingshengii TaxID=334542 RepID=UPI001BEA3B68|nr:YhjD/YihY/BrkB family envelope integrity protein [Rhodococcus qingshengii]MBT2274219.1 YihY family inner membrane protein [Rhodococcus qingshengii]